jgi:hypothetical protein
MARSYYMMQQLQQQYAFAEPRTIEYADRAGKLLTPSQALATGANAEGRLHVVYENGTEVYVNRPAAQSLDSSLPNSSSLRAAGRATAGTWTVMDASRTLHELPASGWVVFNPHNHFFEMSGNIASGRIDYVQAPEFEFLDGRGQWTEFGNLGAAGSVALRRSADGLLEFIDVYGNERIAFRALTATSEEGTASRPPTKSMIAYDAEGKSLGPVELTSPRQGWYEFKPLPGGRRYVCAAVQ